MLSSRLASGQDQSEVFRGVTDARSARRAQTGKGIATASIPAFVAGAELADLAETDPRIVVLTADLASANRLAEFGARHPERFFDLGIAEKNMITAAAGMASTGLIPFAGTFASFAALLGMEQIRTDCAYPRMPVRILAHHSGISLGFYGTSHHALEDLAAMRAIANLVVVCAADGNQLRAILRASLDVPGAVYIRLGRGPDPEVYPEVPAEPFHSDGRSSCATAPMRRSSRPARRSIPRCSPRTSLPSAAATFTSWTCTLSSPSTSRRSSPRQRRPERSWPSKNIT